MTGDLQAPPSPVAPFNTVSPIVKVRSRLDYVDVLRASAAFWVLLVHIYSYWLALGSPVREGHGHSLKALIIRFISLGSASTFSS